MFSFTSNHSQPKFNIRKKNAWDGVKIVTPKLNIIPKQEFKIVPQPKPKIVKREFKIRKQESPFGNNNTSSAI